MKPDQIIDEAEAILSDYGVKYPGTKSVMYSRINQSQKRYFSMAAKADQEFYGLQMDFTLDVNACADFTQLDETKALPIEQIDDFRIIESDNPDQVNKRIHVVPLHDAEAHLKPRATFRSNIFAGFGGDLAGVNRVRLYYTRRPRTIGRDGLVAAATQQVDVELESPWDFLLVWDLVYDLIRRADAMEKELKKGLLELVLGPNRTLTKEFIAHVAGLVHRRQDRHN